MAMVAFASVKASPGTTTLAFAVAFAGGVGHRSIVVETDADGGSAAARLGLGYEPGLVELAAASRREAPAPTTIERFLQPVAPGLAVLCGPASASQAHAALSLASAPMATGLASLSDAQVLVDLGRVTARSVNLELARRSVLTLLVCRPRLDEIQHVRSAVEVLTRIGAPVELVTVGHQPYDPMEVAAQVGCALFGVWVDDPAMASAFWARPAERSRAEGRSNWWRAVVDLGRQLGETTTPRFVSSPGAASAPGLVTSETS